MAEEQKRSKYEDKPPIDGRIVFYIFTGFIFFIAAFTTQERGTSTFDTMLYIAVAFWIFSFIIWKKKRGGFGRFFKPRNNSLFAILMRKMKGEPAIVPPPSKKKSKGGSKNGPRLQ